MKILFFEKNGNRQFIINEENVCYVEVFNRLANPQLTFHFVGHGPLIVTEAHVGEKEFKRIMKELVPAIGTKKK